MVPINKPPFNVIVEYKDWDGAFDIQSVKDMYDRTHFKSKEILIEDLEDTLNKATAIVRNYRGALSLRDRKIVYIFLAVGAVAFLLAIIVGMLM